MKIVLGLGNPGVRYEFTRHNLGFRVVDLLAGRGGLRFRDAALLGLASWTCQAELAGERVVLAKPRTYMNRTGLAAKALCRRFTAGPEDLLAVHDDADLSLGRIRIRTRGGAGGHRGILSITDCLGTEGFPRLRMGIRGEERSAAELVEYVLEPFTTTEETVVREVVELAADAVERFVRDGIDEAMAAYNGRTVSPPQKAGETDSGGDSGGPVVD